MESKDSREDISKKYYDGAVGIILILLSVAALLAGIWRVFAPSEDHLKRLDGTTLLFFGVAGALLLLRDVKSLAFGDYKIEFDRVRKIAQEANAKAEDAKSLALGTGGNQPDLGAMAENIKPVEKGAVAGDPWKGQFGSKSTSGNRQLTATVSRLFGSLHLFAVDLKVVSTQPDQAPLVGSVQFFLHPTFKNDRPIVTVGSNGVAELKLTAWGAFTVGVLADGGITKLELDLSEIEGAPEEFRNN